MPTLAANGINIYYEDTGSGIPILFLHEFAGDHRSWETQVRYFSRRYRCIVYAARGFPPSDVPEDVSAYSQDIAVDDAKGVLDALNIDKAHICGLSMGGYASVLFGVKYPERALSLIIGGCGYGSSSKASDWYGELDEIASAFIKEGMQMWAWTRSAFWCQTGRIDRSLLWIRKAASASVSWMYVRHRSSSLQSWMLVRSTYAPSLCAAQLSHSGFAFQTSLSPESRVGSSSTSIW